MSGQTVDRHMYAWTENGRGGGAERSPWSEVGRGFCWDNTDDRHRSLCETEASSNEPLFLYACLCLRVFAGQRSRDHFNTDMYAQLPHQYMPDIYPWLLFFLKKWIKLHKKC